jgi:hypothetical protein
MPQQQSTSETTSLQSASRRRTPWRRWCSTVLVCAVLFGALAIPFEGAAARDNNDHRVAGAGKTIIEGGTGGTTPVPVTTLVAFHANAQGGNFECLALAPPQPTGPGSGEFSVNAMYVTGQVTSVEVSKQSAVLRGRATVTGIGAGHDQPFTATVTAGGPGATVVLEVSGLTFHETLVDGNINLT